ncbi:PQQ-binding-like beta-propeller repeat protein, partial [Salinicola sp. MH3R3-1]|uniref:PQQ-binding-like beta-propeller repeat protein n=2 Tax=Salinicola sp. MH3R3-1 TaxID=1928762 RepID=UPI000AEC790E
MPIPSPTLSIPTLKATAQRLGMATALALLIAPAPLLAQDQPTESNQSSANSSADDSSAGTQGATQSDAAQSESTQSDSTQSDSTQSDSTQSDSTQSDSTQSDSAADSQDSEDVATTDTGARNDSDRPSIPLVPENATWDSFHGQLNAQKYSPLDQITADNVGDLEKVWEFHTGDVSDGSGDTPASVWSATPVFANDTIYIGTPFYRLIALDPGTGKEKWSFDTKSSRKALTQPVL